MASASDETVEHESGVLIIVENLSVPFDRRVWLECQALTAAGYSVSVICPRGPDDPSEQVIDGVTLYKYRPFAAGAAKATFVVEYVYSFAATAWLTAKTWRRCRFEVLQACNPPDIFWPIALLLRVFGVRFVFDHHDLCPELYESRFDAGSPVLRQRSAGPRVVHVSIGTPRDCHERLVPRHRAHPVRQGGPRCHGRSDGSGP